MRYPSYTNKALRNFFLFSIAFHMILLIFFGRMLRPQKTEFEIEMDIKTISHKRPIRNISWPKKHLNNNHYNTSLLKSKIPSLPDISHLQKKITEIKTDHYSIIHNKLESKPESVAYEVTPVHSITQGINNVPIHQLPIVLTPASSDIDQTKIYKTQILSHIKKHQKYPIVAQRRGIKGTVNVDFLLYSDGTLGDIKVTKESKYRVLNNAAIESIKAGEPYPPFPPAIHRKTILIGVPITFNLVEKTARN